MKLDKSPRYKRGVKKILKAHKLTQEAIVQTEELFLNDPQTPSLRYHQIKCKKDKNRYSISIPNTQYRILLSNFGDMAILVALLDHDEYDKNNKDC